MRRRSNRNPWMLIDPLDQIIRHSSLKFWSADDNGHGLRVVSQMKRRLAGGVPAADDHYVATSQSNCFFRRGAVADSGANELLNPRRLKSPVVHPGGDDTGSDFDHRTARQFHSERPSIGWASGHELC